MLWLEISRWPDPRSHTALSVVSAAKIRVQILSNEVVGWGRSGDEMWPCERPMRKLKTHAADLGGMIGQREI